MLIGLCGQKECGKSTVANILVKALGYKEYAFATKLKKMCSTIFKVPIEDMHDKDRKELDFEKPIVLTQEHCNKIFDWVAYNDWKVSCADLDKMKKHIGASYANPRKLMQGIGTEVCRDTFDPLIHAKLLFKQLEQENYQNYKIVISDARFVNERKMIRQKDGLNILIKCAEQIDNHSDHESENQIGEITDYDYVLYNSKEQGLEILKEKTLALFEVITKDMGS